MSKKKQHPEISDAELDKQLKQVRVLNANDSLLQTSQTKTANVDERTPQKVTKFFTMPVVGNKQSP
jgi:hypothetical protein